MRTPSEVMQYRTSGSAIPPPHFVHAHRLLEPFRHELAAVREQEPLAAAQPTHRIRHQDLASSAFAAMREARITVAPNRSPSSSIGSPALRPTRTFSASPS